MKITFFITLLLSINLILACDDEAPSKDNQTQTPDMDIPVQMMHFDTMEIEPDPDLGPDMDD